MINFTGFPRGVVHFVPWRFWIRNRYKVEDKDWWKKEDIRRYNAKYGGETGAALLTKYLKPEDHTIYTDNNKGSIVLQLKLKNDPNGNIELYKKFWNFPEDEKKNNC